MAIGVIATITIREGKNAEFEQLFTGLTEQVWPMSQGRFFMPCTEPNLTLRFIKFLSNMQTKTR